MATPAVGNYRIVPVSYFNEVNEECIGACMYIRVQLVPATNLQVPLQTLEGITGYPDSEFALPINIETLIQHVLCIM